MRRTPILRYDFQMIAGWFGMQSNPWGNRVGNAGGKPALPWSDGLSFLPRGWLGKTWWLRPRAPAVMDKSGEGRKPDRDGGKGFHGFPGLQGEESRLTPHSSKRRG